MIYVYGAVVAGLAIAAFTSRGWTRAFLVLCIVINLASIAKALLIGDPYAFSLRPNPGPQPFEHEY